MEWCACAAAVDYLVSDDVHHGGTKGSVREFESETHAIIGAAIEVHRALGPGLLESAYAKCLALELREAGLRFHREVPIPLSYKGLRLDVSYRADLIVEEKVIVEVKCVQKLEPIHRAQLLTYLKLTGLRIGLLFNFNSPMLRTGTIRLVL
jgi:GxxExxY protein